jgi:hypothetical protein
MPVLNEAIAGIPPRPDWRETTDAFIDGREKVRKSLPNRPRPSLFGRH